MQKFIPTYTAEEQVSLQDRGLRWTVEQAFTNSAQYRKKLKNSGLHDPREVRGLQDLHSLPFTSADDLREGYPLPLLSVAEKNVVRVHSSSGTTGKRKVLAYTQKDVDTFTLQMARCYEMAGLSAMDRVQIAVGYGLWTAGVGFQMGCERFGAMAVPVGAGNLEIHLQLLADLQSTCLCCTSSMALLMGEEVARYDLSEKIALKKVIFGSELHNRKMRKAFERSLGLEESFDIAGMTEMYGPGSAIECGAHAGLHYWSDLFIIEFLDPESLQPVAEGEVGEMVVTSLCKEASPLIRYRTKDLCRAIPGDCACGCSMPRHDHILGRSDDMIIYRGVNIYPGQIAGVLEQFEELGSEYHILLTRKNGRDSMELQVERQGAQNNFDEMDLCRAVEQALQKFILASIHVTLCEPASLPRTFGKSKRITDSRLDD